MSVLDQFTDKQLEEELKRRKQKALDEWRAKVAACEHDWSYYSDYYSKIKTCKKCGYQI